MFTIKEGAFCHCTALVRRLRPEVTAVAIGLGVDARAELRNAFRSSGFARSWISDDGAVLAMYGVSGPLLATEGTVWLALSREATRHPKAILREARRQLAQLGAIKHRLLAEPFLADPASVRFARRLGFVEREDQDEAQKLGAVAMVLNLRGTN